MRLPLVPLTTAAALLGTLLVHANAQSPEKPDPEKLRPTRIYVTDLPQPELDAKNENLNPGLVMGPLRQDRSRRIEWRHKLVDQRVQVEGIALGEAPQQPNHMTAQRVAYEGGRIYIRGVDFRATRAAGQLVRVTGALRLEPESTLSFIGAEGKVEQYFYIEADSVKVIEQTSDPVLMAPGLK